jgi:hypothetical protein
MERMNHWKPEIGDGFQLKASRGVELGIIPITSLWIAPFTKQKEQFELFYYVFPPPRALPSTNGGIFPILILQICSLNITMAYVADTCSTQCNYLSYKHPQHTCQYCQDHDPLVILHGNGQSQCILCDNLYTLCTLCCIFFNGRVQLLPSSI